MEKEILDKLAKQLISTGLDSTKEPHYSDNEPYSLTPDEEKEAIEHAVKSARDLS